MKAKTDSHMGTNWVAFCLLLYSQSPALSRCPINIDWWVNGGTEGWVNGTKDHFTFLAALLHMAGVRCPEQSLSVSGPGTCIRVFLSFLGTT